jgi:hypothetical protein
MKNTHLQHPEDSILTGNLSVLDWFIILAIFLSRSIAAPAVVFGTNPATGKFFVGTEKCLQQSEDQDQRITSGH